MLLKELLIVKLFTNLLGIYKMIKLISSFNQIILIIYISFLIIIRFSTKISFFLILLLLANSPRKKFLLIPLILAKILKYSIA